MKATTKRWLGITLIATPIPLLVLVLSLYAVISFVLAAMGGDPSMAAGAATSGGDLRMFIGTIINVILGAIGIACVLGIFVGIPAGIVLITLSEVDPEVKRIRAKELEKNPHYKN